MKKKKVKKPVKKTKKKVIGKKAVKKPKKKLIKKKKPVPVKAKKSSIPKNASLEEVGVITHYFPKVDAAVVKITKSVLSLGDTIFIKGHTSDFTEKVTSMQLDHTPLQNAEVGQEIGLKVKSKVREHDVIYKLIA